MQRKLCPQGDNCKWAHSLFELWMHPEKFRTRLCEKGLNCDWPLCFFAHVPEDLRVATGSAATASGNASPCSTPEISPCTTPIAGSPLRFPPQLYPDAYPFGRMQPSFDLAGGGSGSIGSAMPGPSTSPPSMLPSYTKGAIDNILAAANLIERPGTGNATPASSASPVVTPRRGSYGTFSDFSDGSASPKLDMQAAAMTMGFDAGGGGPFSNVAAGTPGAGTRRLVMCCPCLCGTPATLRPSPAAAVVAASTCSSMLQIPCHPGMPAALRLRSLAHKHRLVLQEFPLHQVLHLLLVVVVVVVALCSRGAAGGPATASQQRQHLLSVG